MTDALLEAARQGFQWRYTGPQEVPLVPLPPERRKPEDWPQSGKKDKPEPEGGEGANKADPLFSFRGGAHVDIRQARGQLALIKQWIKDWDADWHRNRDGSYQAAIYRGEDDEPEEGPDEALDDLQTAAEEVPGPALLRFGLWYRESEQEAFTRKQAGRSPKPLRRFDADSEDEDEGGEVVLELHYTKLSREFNSAQSLANGWRMGVAPEPDRGRLEVMWPSIKGDERR